MKRFKLELRLEEEVILSARSVTAGSHQTLDYIPGATLLGSCAAQLYSRLSKADAFSLFHAMTVRFGDGQPVTSEGERALPIPFSWHVIKGKGYRQAGDNTLLNGDAVCNLAQAERVEGKQWKQLRIGYVTARGQLVQPVTTFRMKTAINPETAVAAEAQLFGYAALQAGQRFQAWLDIDDEVSDTLVEQLGHCLSGELRLGRSRSAQYGTVTCMMTEENPVEQVPVIKGKQLSLLFLSDMALRDEQGMATLRPTATSLGLPVKVDWSRTFLRFRRYSPYNTARRCHDQERQLIQRGSVLTLDVIDVLKEADYQHLQRGIGDYLHSGLGQVAVNPSLLTDALPMPKQVVSVEEKQVIPQPNTDLANWLVTYSKIFGARRSVREEAGQRLAALEEMYCAARCYAGEEVGCVGPGASQWGRVTAAGKHGNHFLDKLEEIVAYNQEDDRIENEEWQVQTGLSGDRACFGRWLLASFRAEDEMERAGEVAALLGRLADELVRKLARREAIQ